MVVGAVASELELDVVQRGPSVDEARSIKNVTRQSIPGQVHQPFNFSSAL
jgi:hypothetical protein